MQNYTACKVLISYTTLIFQNPKSLKQLSNQSDEKARLCSFLPAMAHINLFSYND